MESIQHTKDEKTNLNIKLLLLRPTEVASNVEGKPTQLAHNDSLMGAIRPALLIARLFGILPIPNVNSDGKRIDFRWRSFRSIYALLILFCILTEALLSVARLAVIGVTFQSSVNAVFFCMTLAAAFIFLRLAISWKSMAHCWDYVEQNVMGSYGLPSNLGQKTLYMTIFMMTGGFAEFLLSQLSTIADVWLCTKKTDASNIIRQYFLIKFSMMFYVTNYAWWKGMILFFISTTATFTWNFVDLMIVLISMALSARFHLLNDLIFSCDGQKNPREFWRRVRETYFTLSELTRETDRRFGTLVLLSFAGNLYFICLQLMHSVSTRNISVYYDVYFLFSVMFVTFRMFLVGIMASGIYEESVRPKKILYNVTTENYCEEVDRFLKQVCSDQIAITGRNFFAVTRSMLLTVAGTVVTYEIILVQLNPGTSPNADTGLIGQNDTIASCKL